MSITNTIETETWHDRRPSHPVRPYWLTRLERQVDDFVHLSDQAVDAYIDNPTEETKTEMLQVGDMLKAYSNLLLEAKECYFNGRIPAWVAECTCREDSAIKCKACTEYLKAQFTDELIAMQTIEIREGREIMQDAKDDWEGL